MADVQEMKFESNGFSKRLKSMLKVDFRRMFTMPFVYIMLGVCLVLPILILVMTSMMGTATDPATGSEISTGFTNVWQSISSTSNTGGLSMDLTSMCNMNMLYFLIAVLVCVFVADDFKSGYAKNLFTVRSKKVDYVISKTLVCFVGAVGMLLTFFIGAMLGGAIAGLSFDAGVSSGQIFACLLAKFFLALLFVSIYLVLAVIGKQRTWLSILSSFVVGMLMFMTIPMMTPLDASALHPFMCLAGGAIFSVGLGAVSNLILNKTSLV